MIVKLKGKYSKTLKAIANFNKILLKFVIITSSEPYHCFKRLNQALNSFTGSKIHKFGTIIFQKYEFVNFIKKIAKSRVIKILITTP